MRFIKERIGKMLDYLQQQIYPQQVMIEQYKMLKAEENISFDIKNLDTASWETFAGDQIWGGHREYYWFGLILQFRIALPENVSYSK